jgi:hypothetical protein
MLRGLHQLLVNEDFEGYKQALPLVGSEWERQRREAEEQWGGIVAMDHDGALLGLRPVDAGSRPLEYVPSG